jgi:excinuclease ABC subunit C
MTRPELKSIIDTIPNLPGIYKYYDATDLIYVGKAKNLRKRVQSYFAKNHLSYKTRALVQNIANIDFTITNTERDALLLENSLIKEFQPKYNINLKDDKTYPWIVIKNEHFPRIFFTRQKINDGSQYFGPYTSVAKVRDLLRTIKELFQYRTCKLNLAPKEIAKNKYKVCLEYHLGNCKAPCVHLQSEESYNNDVQQIKHYLRGNLAPVKAHLRTEMNAYATNMEFEKAAVLKSRLQSIENYKLKTDVTNIRVPDCDVFNVKKGEDLAIVSYLIVVGNSIVSTHNQIVHLYADESEAEILEAVIPMLQENFGSVHTDIVVPLPITLANENCVLSIPESGDKKKLLEFTTKNCLYHLNELIKSKTGITQEEIDTENILSELQQYMQLTELPTHIECFDNSNFQGTNAVSAMVCFKNGKPSKSDYRHFNVKTVQGIDDFATMKEAVGRRYSRLIKEKSPLPQLVVIDGGKGQLSAANEAIMELGLQGQLTLVGLAKNVEEVFFLHDSESMKMPYNSQALRLLRRLRDEVHRFGITHHRNKRSKASLKSEWTNIKGIGEKTVMDVLKVYKSMKKAEEAGQNEVAKIIGLSKATILFNYLESKKKA